MKNKLIKLIVIVLIMIILAFVFLKIINNKVMPIYLNYTEVEMKRLVTTVINKSITDDLIQKLNMNNLFIVKNDESNQTIVIDFDPVVLNRVMASISDCVYDNLKLISERDSETLKKYNVSDSIFYIPIGIIFDSVMLNNLGPKIPVRLEIISSINPDIETKVTEYGINNSLIEVFIHVIASVKVVLPMSSREIEITVVVPLAVKMIQGSVPEYYLGDFLNKKTID